MNHKPLLPASLIRRSIAYTIDFLIILLPIGLAVWFTVTHFFETLPLLGWLTLAVLALIVFAYTLVLAAQNSSSGQTLGKRLTGLRVVQAGSLEPGYFSDSYFRGFIYLCGLAGLGIAPLVMAIRTRGRDESESWPHRSSDSRVIDIVRGKDPLSLEEKFYPVYPEEWGQQINPDFILDPTDDVAEADPSPWKIRVVNPWDPADTGQARVTASTHLETNNRLKQQERKRTVLQSSATLLTVGALVATVVFAAYAINPQPPKPRDEREILASSLTEKLPVSGSDGQGFPGYSSQADWSQPIGGEVKKVLATSENIYVFAGEAILVYSTADGHEVTRIPLTDSVALSAPTTYDGHAGIYWAVGDTAYGWSEQVNAGAPFEHPLPEGAQPYTAGNELLFAATDSGNNGFRAWTFGVDGFREMAVPDGFVPSSVSAGQLVSYDVSGNIKISDSQGQEVSAYPLTKPESSRSNPSGDLSLAGVVASGNQRIFALWSPHPENTEKTNPMTIATYDAASGELLSYIETTRERINDQPDLVWGNGGVKAMYAGYLFAVDSGRAEVDVTAQDITPGSVIGEGSLGDTSLGSVYVTARGVSSVPGAVTPLLADQQSAVVRRSNTLEKYSR